VRANLAGQARDVVNAASVIEQAVDESLVAGDNLRLHFLARARRQAPAARVVTPAGPDLARDLT